MPVVFAYRDLILSCPMAELPGVVSKLTFKDLPDVERVCQRASKLVASTPRAFRADLYVCPACASLLEPGWLTGADVASPQKPRVLLPCATCQAGCSARRSHVHGHACVGARCRLQQRV